jgi:hypothetical protein
MKTQQTLEPVHIRADQPPDSERPASTESVAPASSEQNKRAPEVPLTAVQAEAQKPAPPKVKQPPSGVSSNVVPAIVATVVIVLGIAGLAVLAYIKTQK